MTVKSSGTPSLLEEVRRQTEVMGRYALETGLEFPGEGERLWGKMEGEITLEELAARFSYSERQVTRLLKD